MAVNRFRALFSPAPISTASWAGGTATFTTAIPHLLAQNETCVVSGVTPSGYNGILTVAGITSSTIFTVTMSNPGSYTSGGTVTP
jgi:hypothetical protein